MIDLSPGTAELAKAVLSAPDHVSYRGFAYDSSHLNLLTNIIDTHALKLVTKEGSLLFQQDLATMVRDLYSDVVAEKAEDEEQTCSEPDTP